MGVIDLSAYKPVPATLGDANQVANGFQAIQNLLNGSIDNNNFAAGLIFDPAKIMQAAAIDGDPLVWDNTLGKWKPASAMAAGRPRAPRVVVSTMAGGPPASPVDQDIWVATAVDANGTRWAFQYNAGSGSAFKWEFLGGPAAIISDTSGFAFASTGSFTTYTSRIAFTAARAGLYEVHGSMSAGNASGVTGNYTYGLGVAGVAVARIGWTSQETGQNLNIVAQPVTVTVTAGQTINGMYACDQAGVGGSIGLAITPTRIS